MPIDHPILWSGVEQSIVAPRLSWQKRLRIMWAVWQQRQMWHVKTCAECAGTWVSSGPHHEELIHVCDACDAARIDRMLEFSQQEYERITKGAA